MSWRYLVRRLLQVVPSVGAILVATFAVIHLTPGDPAVALAGEAADPAYVAQLRTQYGFDQPVIRQFGTYVGNVVRGDLGDSFSYGVPVTRVIAAHVGPTLLLTGTALVLSTTFGVLLGALAARRPFGRLDLGINTAALLGYAVPGFWLAQVAVLVLSVHLGLFPVLGYTDVRTLYTGAARWADIGYHLMLPAAVLAASEIALLTRTTRTGLLGELGKDYVRVAQAKGVAPDQVLLGHALRNAILPVVTVIGARIGFLLSGALIIETVFSWPGLGTLVVAAVQGSDRPVMLGVVLLAAFSVLLANLLTDLVYAWSDPRIRYH